MCSEQSGKIPVGMAGLKNPIGDFLEEEEAGSRVG